MSNTHHAFDYLAAPERFAVAGLCAVFGDDAFLKRLVVKQISRQVLGDRSDAPAAVYECDERIPDWRDVADELATVSMFGGAGPRLVILERADAFVSANRPRLEDMASGPRRAGVLILEVEDWAANTRLYKALDLSGLQINCRPPLKGGKSKDLDERAIAAWVVRWGASQHQLQLTTESALHLLELTGPSFGLLDQDLAKLALLVPQGSKVTPHQVHDIIGGWRTKQVWDLVNAAAAGDAAEALRQLDQHLQSGEHPLALVGSLSWSLRRYAGATRIFQQSERSGRKISLRDALVRAGVKDWPPGELAGAEERLKQLGRTRAGSLYRWLLDLDLSLKGSHSSEDRARWAIEQLILRMAKRPVTSR